MKILHYLKYLSSFKLTLFVLVSLMFLVFFGTLYQAEHGLYLAQKKFFDSLIIVDGFLILPGAVLIMCIAFINLSAFLCFKFKYSWAKSGIFIIHLGLMSLLLGGFYTLYFSKESLISLREGEQSNFSTDYYKWQLRVIKESTKNGAKSINEILIPFDLDSKNINPESIKALKKALPQLNLEKYYPNGRVFETPFAGTIPKELELNKEFEQNTPLFIFSDSETQEKVYLDNFDYRVLTYEKRVGEEKKTETIQISLDRVSSELPVIIRLEDVRRELHPNTQVAKAYASTISVLEEGSNKFRKVEISMNKPFRYKDYTFYQASYGVDTDGVEFSSLAVVKNAGRLVPYISSLLTVLGLAIHFLMHFLKFIKYQKTELTL